MNTPSIPPGDWRDRLARGDADPASVAAWRRAMADDPRAAGELEAELALEGALAAASAPRASSNFTRRTLDAVHRETRRVGKEVADPVTAWRRWLAWRAPALAGLALLAGLGAWRWHGRPSATAVAAAEVTRMAAVGGIPPSALADFDAVRRLDAAARPEDEALVIALLQ